MQRWEKRVYFVWEGSEIFTTLSEMNPSKSELWSDHTEPLGDLSSDLHRRFCIRPQGKTVYR